MKITKIIIENYKSIKKIEIPCSPKLNAFIGENSAGKSNIFDAINWPLGPVYPSFNATLPQDHYLGRIENEISISLHFDDGRCLQLAEKWIYKGHPKSGLNLSSDYIADPVRQNYCSAYLGVERKILDYMPSNRWSLLGRILMDINRMFELDKFVNPDTGEVRNKTDVFKAEIERIRDDILFSVQNEHGDKVMEKFIKILQEESAKQLNRPEADFKIDLNLYDPWNFYRTLQMIVHETDLGLSFQASSLGMGVQASISIAVLKAYSRLKLGNGTPLFIDEPELFLHPQAQRNFYKVLQELADNGTQVFYTTHSPDFLTVARFNEIFLVRKSKTDGTYVRYANPDDFVVDLKLRTGIVTSPDDLMLYYKNAYEETGDTQKANEGFFAKKIILVEGQSESLLLPYLFNLLGYDYIAKGITIVRCGSKGELDRFYRLYSEFGIPCYIIFDGDRQHEGTAEEGDTIIKNKTLLSLFGILSDFPDNTVTANFLGFERTLNDNIGFQTSKKGLDLFKQIRTHITSSEHVPGWVQPVIQQIENLNDTVNSILIR